MTDSVRVFLSLSFENQIEPRSWRCSDYPLDQDDVSNRSFATVVTTKTFITCMGDLHHMRFDLLVARERWKAS